MKKTIAAALLSLLVFPGTGHVYLQRIRTGMAIMAASLLALLVFMAGIFRLVWQMLDDIGNGLIPADTVVLTEVLTRKMQDGGPQSSSIALTILLCLWIGSVIDAVRIGLQEKP